MQGESKEKLEEWYKNPDPWKYQVTIDDSIRREKILACLKEYAPFERALDIGCGEGFITSGLPAKSIYGFDLSEKAMGRLPSNIKAIKQSEILGLYDLIIATGVFYKHYDYQWIIDTINKHASGVVLVCNIIISEVPEVVNLKNQIYLEEFPYREWSERIRIYDYRT
jgi:2-polyprenyl-3-methyl-5-hydroxy-6-metoxy-1,4-benzoquinol methylase